MSIIWITKCFIQKRLIHIPKDVSSKITWPYFIADFWYLVKIEAFYDIHQPS